jgi:hypothetical protein
VGKTIGDKKLDLAAKDGIFTFHTVAYNQSLELDLAAKEGTFAFHTVTHNQSFQSMDCTSTIMQKLFEPKFTCAETKVQAIVVNVLAPLSTLCNKVLLIFCSWVVTVIF